LTTAAAEEEEEEEEEDDDDDDDAHSLHSWPQQKKSGALVRQPTTPTERPPLLGEVSANFSG
jgi:hypothetical protein